MALLLKTIFESEPDFKVVGHARDGREAVQMAHDLRPDIITMDIHMPCLDGFEATRMIMVETPVPIVVVSSSVDDEELDITFRAIEEGALAVIEKPRGVGHPDFDMMRAGLVDTVRAMSEIKVVTRKPCKRNKIAEPVETRMVQEAGSYHILALGCSTGGPQVLQNILSSLPVDFPVPVVIVQHIAKGFIAGMVKWLSSKTLLRVKLAEQGEVLRPGTVYFGPDDQHLCVKRDGGRLTVNLTEDQPVNGFRPSVTPLFQSLSQHCAGRTIAGLLTGMGGDGAQGLLEAHQAQCHTFIQDEKSSVVFGMPGTALALGAVDQIVALDKISDYVTSMVRK